MSAISMSYVDTRRQEQSRRRLVKAAQWCGLLPMLAGSLILLGWVATGSNLLPLLGGLNVVLGIALFGAGLGLVYALYLQTGRTLPGMGVALGLLLANFPLAIGYAVVAGKVEEQRMQQAQCRQMAKSWGDEPTGLADARRPPC